MNSIILVSANREIRQKEIMNFLTAHGFDTPHPDLLVFDQDEKLGVEEAKKIREHLSIKPLTSLGRGVVVLNADKLTPDAQNALLKSLEEPGENSLVLLGVRSENNLLPTILSRCQIIFFSDSEEVSNEFVEDIKRLESEDFGKRFEFIEKLEKKEEFLKALLKLYRNDLYKNTELVSFVNLLLEAEKWKRANVNIRAILEYLMLKMPKRVF